MKDSAATLWEVTVNCINPIRKRSIAAVRALSYEQAEAIAEKKAEDAFGIKGRFWISLEVHMQNMT